MKKFDFDNILNITSLDNELELEKAMGLQLKLRVIIKEKPEFLGLRKHLLFLIKEYETKNYYE